MESFDCFVGRECVGVAWFRGVVFEVSRIFEACGVLGGKGYRLALVDGDDVVSVSCRGRCDGRRCQ